MARTKAFDLAAARILVPGGASDHVVDGFLGQTRFVAAPDLRVC